ncbi:MULTISPECIES: RluA family pseudouridine synthase [unclassified Paenibacillus]|uniref:RluA family pseudouridine synthase n=1 Tax=unclassified Paenibacillus TaxID=185978 RepID=UPI001AE8B48E|nr:MULTISPECIES: RluA family pseudouridine synthase [unclassified Paenibacillus]MBP1156600.1 23S rRNA pseudouridine1911/1915/1917 synthase [Paenibacillus sp. PvP091]MBP1172662.1 23S rRNA pseudouridine1911/1915/1917 synthase [Paenibacillus sp. PvR098]MBP2439042.1 23S rRNA pseudouridine1911/1915/1917 synthase [Paenibacillus sp. PvP052]
MSVWRRKGEWLEWTAEQDVHSIEDIRHALAVTVGDRFLQKLFRSSNIQWKGRRVMLRLFPEETLQYVPEWTEVEVLYEDDFSLVANKPAGMKVHPTRDGETGTLLHALGSYLESTGQRCRPRHIHRLDEDTTGPVLLAKNEWAQSRLDEAMRDKRVERIYVALVQGHPPESRGRIDAPIGRDRHHATRRRVSRTGDPAVTHYEVLERLDSASLVRLRLETGRTHQIRVHMSHLGHPLLGDSLYGGRTAGMGMARQALHGEQLVFSEPFTGERMEVRATWPDDFAVLYEQLKK